MQDIYRALVLDVVNGQSNMQIQERSIADLPEGEVTIRVAYSSVNFKDGMATLPNRIIRKYPMVPGIDLAGIVIASTDERYQEGDQVIATSYEIGVSHPGGFSEIARVPAKWVVPLPDGLTMKEAMILGTAGFTAALSIIRLEENGLSKEQGPVLVTGSTGGVGSVAVDILAKNGYKVSASTGKESEHAYLKELGATTILHRNEVVAVDDKPMRQQLWAGAVDPVGGKTLEYLLSTMKYGGSVALSGLTGGTDVSTSVYPFILRGVNLLGIDSVYCPMNQRKMVWERLASDMKPNHLTDQMVKEITLEELPKTLSQILEGQIRGRTIVKL
ncbi:acryloyl-CoA reductase [Brevibacillus laterosporus]|uniref:acrylyl-CoA reductase family protein n=1 Tax=Brevibacillus laterosporus TaxID=1465 RepID=UPI0003B1BAD2|nr:acryloyl-CoA reductase [Brevibacillus laterosporus]ERM18863.1 quinone oxidoreductase [Brevibacillus laterosporus PE36]